MKRKNKIKGNKGITLIALVVTIVILIILAGVSMAMVLGENGLFEQAKKGANSMASAEVNTQVSFNELYQEITGELTNANIIIYLDKTESNVDSVIITVEGTIEEDEIIEIECPDGSKVQGNVANYEVNKNGEYTFLFTTKEGKKGSKSIKVTNIKEGIDLTGLVTGEDPGHNHVFPKKFDDNNHYEECVICGLKQNIEAHNITRKIAMENLPACHTGNYYINSCKCGYYKTEYVGHISEGKIYTAPNEITDFETCSVCNAWAVANKCIKSDGSIINCNNLGVCSRCGYNYNKKTHEIIENSTGGKCRSCGEHLIEPLENSYVYNEQNNQYVFTFKFKILDSNLHIVDNSAWHTTNVGFNKISMSNTRDNGIETVTATMEPENRYQGMLKFNGRICYKYGTSEQQNNIVFEQKIIPEVAKSEIQEIKVADIGESQGWTKQKQITVKGMDNWSNNVKISMQNSSGNIIYDEVIVPVNNNNYEYTFIPELEAGEEGETYTIVVKDVFEKSKTKDITVNNIDFKAPQLASDTHYIEGWSRAKEIKIEATDEGIGNVQIAFNNENDYQAGQIENGKYTRKYLFTGDVYESVQGGIYLKDGLENKQMSTIKIGKIDNKSPTITKVETRKEGEKTIVTINANDINEKLGQEGSGISGYAITKTKQLPEDNMYKENNEIQLQEAGTYYVYVKDNVGNISARYTLEINK